MAAQMSDPGDKAGWMFRGGHADLAEVGARRVAGGIQLPAGGDPGHGLLDLAEDLDFVRADHGQIEQVLLNLINNAGDAISGTGSITITTAAAGDHVQVTISDTGRGMTADEQAKLAAEEGRARFRNIWIVVISLFVTVIGITNSMLMSVTERFREIGTMKCLGALSAFVRQMFLLESSLVGLVGAVALGLVEPALLLPLVVGGRVSDPLGLRVDGRARHVRRRPLPYPARRRQIGVCRVHRQAAGRSHRPGR